MTFASPRHAVLHDSPMHESAITNDTTQVLLASLDNSATSSLHNVSNAHAQKSIASHKGKLCSRRDLCVGTCCSNIASITSKSLSVPTVDNNDTTIHDLRNLPLQPTLNVPSYADGSIYGQQSLSVSGVASVVMTAPQSVTLGSACRSQSANTDTNTAATQESNHGTAQATLHLQASTASSSASTDSGSATQNIQRTVNLYTQNRVVALGQVNGKTIYSRDIPAEIQIQYLTIEAKLTKGLRKYLEKKKKSKKGLTMTLMMLGQNSRTNEPYIVLTCEPKSETFVRNYLHKDRVEPIWRGEGGNGFKLEIDTMIPQSATFEAFQNSSCSFSIEYRHKGRSLFATIGGNMILCYPNGSSRQYGLTVNHLFDFRRDDDSEDAASSHSNPVSEDSNGSSERNESTVSSSSTISSQDSDAENRLDFCESVRITTTTSPQQSQGGITATGSSIRIVDGKLVPKTFVSRVARNRDWALIEYVEQPLSVFDVENKPQGCLEAATFDSLEGSLPVYVVHRGTAHTGRLNATPTTAVVPGGSRPVSVYTFSFDEAPVDTGGMSGSWVVGGTEYHVQLYGQVVAKDAFGSLHVVPIVDILQDVKRVFKVDMVYLHSHSTVSEEIEGVPVPTSPRRFISSDPKHEDTQSHASDDEAPSNDSMRMHANTKAHTISSSIELHTTPGLSQGSPTEAAGSQQEQDVGISILGLGNTLGGAPQAADVPFNSFAMQHKLERGKKRKLPESTWITARNPAEFKSKRIMTTVRKKAMDTFLQNDGKPIKKSKSSTGRLRCSSVDSESRGSTQSELSTASEYPITDLSTLSTSLSIGTSSVASTTEESSDGTSLSSDSETAKMAGLVAKPQQAQDFIFFEIPWFPKGRAGIPTPYDLHIPAPFVSIGKKIDPFSTVFQSSHSSVSIEELKFHYNRYFGTRALEKYWIPTALSYPHTFLGTLCLATAYHDVVHERELESVQTIALRQEIIHLIGRNMLDPEARVSDHNIMAIIQLIISEVMSREDLTLIYHQDGIEAMIRSRGGLNKLGMNGHLASAISWVFLATSILREQKPRSMYAEYCASNSMRLYNPTSSPPESPIYCPRAEWVTIPRSKRCTLEAGALLEDIKTMINLFLNEIGSSQGNSQALMGLCEKIMNPAKYPPIFETRKTRILTQHDYKYEAIRIASLIQTVAIIRRISLSNALSHAIGGAALSDSLVSPREVPVGEQLPSPSISVPSTSSEVSQRSYFQEFSSRSSASSADALRPSFSSSATRPSISVPHSASLDHVYFPRSPAPEPSGSTTLLKELRATIERSNISACWSDMAGVLLWVCMVAGAASRQSESKFHKKYFSALTMRLGVTLCFEHPEAINSTMLRMSKVIEALGAEKETPEKAEGKGKGKNRRA